MPIVDIEEVSASPAEFSPPPAAQLADALGAVFGTAAGKTWVRFRLLERAAYAENQSNLRNEELPVFVTVLHARPPTGEALALEAMAVTVTVAQCLARTQQRVHVQFAPPALGRQAFGGHLVT